MAFFSPSFFDSIPTAAVTISLLLTLILITLPSQRHPDQDSEQEQGNSSHAGTKASSPHGHSQTVVSVQVVVLGDLGRSPRMQYHALSIANHGASVDFIGYRESEIPENITTNQRISVVPIAPPPKLLQTSNKLLFLLVAPLKVLWQIWSLYYVLGYRTKAAKWMLVQNPPSIPTLAVAFFICFIRNTKLVIDWHNFGYSILALKLGESHSLVRISKIYEIVFSKTASAHFTVTNAMARVLKKSFNEEAFVLHDRPASHFQPLTPEQRISFLKQLPETSQDALAIGSGQTRLLVSSTSWTADEDFALLLSALVEYSAKVRTNTRQVPKLSVIITGKGPQEKKYLSQIARLNSEGKLSNVTIRTAWLSMSDYASLLGSADLGVSLHTSSSGVDLPMKVVDMFGAGLPVVGWSKFEAWPELVTEGVNGRGFGSANELCDLLVELFGDMGVKLSKLKEGAMMECERRWDDEWDPVAGRLLGFVD
jgi:beta-1,4-mannosyltransferase